MAANLLIALGSNRRHGRHGAPRGVLKAAIAALAGAGFRVMRTSTLRTTAPLGPGGRSYANAVVAAQSALAPPAALAALKAIERSFGRRRGRRWGARVLDLDLLAYDDSVVRLPGLVVPHPRLHLRDFVLQPLVEVAPRWRHPLLAETPRQMRFRLRRPRRSGEGA